MEQYTKTNPGSYTDMINHIAKLESSSTTKEIKFTSVELARKAKNKYSDMYMVHLGKRMRCLGIEILKGNERCYRFSSCNLPIDTVFESVSVEVTKSLKDFNTVPENGGKYKQCEGGGWYSNTTLYKIGNCFFA